MPFSHPVCVAAFLLIRPSQEVEQMLPWHPSGPRAPALPPTAGAPRRTPHIPSPLTARGLSHEKEGSPSQYPHSTAEKSTLMLLSFMFRVCIIVWETPVSYQTGPLGSFEVFPLRFNTLLTSWLSHTHTPFKKQTQMTEMHRYDVSWRGIVPWTK